MPNSIERAVLINRKLLSNTAPLVFWSRITKYLNLACAWEKFYQGETILESECEGYVYKILPSNCLRLRHKVIKITVHAKRYDTLPPLYRDFYAIKKYKIPETMFMIFSHNKSKIPLLEKLLEIFPLFGLFHLSLYAKIENKI